MTNNIILFASYWNEIDWIEASLAQIDQIDPVEVIICDGCFDPTQPVPSTDGTREIIKEYVGNKENAKFVSAQRVSRVESVRLFLKLFREHQQLCVRSFKPVIQFLTRSPYRRNQAYTFNQMVNISEFWEPGRWFMTYDCDQFYPEEVIDRFKICGEETNYGLLTAKELTFLDSFDTYTSKFEDREYNNMPHKIYTDTVIQPTRNILKICTSRKNFELSGFWSDHNYIEQVESLHIGEYYHYKLRPEERQAKGYELGDRQEPDWGEYTLEPFQRDHPSVITEYVLEND